MRLAILPAAAAVLATAVYAAAANSGPSDPEIAHIAYTAGAIDVAAARLALDRSGNQAVRAFAETMIRDHEAVNAKALALVRKLNVTPQDNPVSVSLGDEATASMKRLESLDGPAFDRAYARHEADYHKTVNGALRATLIPAADNQELKALLQSGLALFGEHQRHAESLTAELE